MMTVTQIICKLLIFKIKRIHIVQHLYRFSIISFFLQFVVSTVQELDQNIDNLEKEKKDLNNQLEEKGAEITNLNGRIKEQDQELDEKFLEIVQLASAVDDLRDELEEVWTSYHNDREWWKQRADKVLG